MRRAKKKPVSPALRAANKARHGKKSPPGARRQVDKFAAERVAQQRRRTVVGKPEKVNGSPNPASTQKPSRLAAPGAGADKAAQDRRNAQAGAPIQFFTHRQLEKSPLNPRHAGPNRDGMIALARNIAEQGLLKPILARPRSGGAHEIVDGGRRHEAIGMAIAEGLLDRDYKIATVLRAVTDAELLEIAGAANFGAESTHPMDDAELIERRLAMKPRVKDAVLWVRLGMPERTYWRRKALLALPAGYREAYRTGNLTGDAALRLADEAKKAALAAAKPPLPLGDTSKNARGAGVGGAASDARATTNPVRGDAPVRRKRAGVVAEDDAPARTTPAPADRDEDDIALDQPGMFDEPAAADPAAGAPAVMTDTAAQQAPAASATSRTRPVGTAHVPDAFVTGVAIAKDGRREITFTWPGPVHVLVNLTYSEAVRLDRMLALGGTP